MPSVYEMTLPRPFPYRIQASPADVREYVEVLMDENRRDVPNGSSFAVDVGPGGSHWNLWLSKISRDYLTEQFGLDEDYIGRTEWPTLPL